MLQIISNTSHEHGLLLAIVFLPITAVILFKYPTQSLVLILGILVSAIAFFVWALSHWGQNGWRY
jgi:hypothetical protein